MPNLTTKELTALSDQLDFERVLHCKYLSAVQECQIGRASWRERV